MSRVFIALQANEDSRCIVEAIVDDNPEAIVNRQPAMVKIDVPGRLVIRRASIEERLGRHFDLQEVHIHLISLSGHVDETEDEMTLSWDR
ncbi:MAG: MmoB/DmpM family protein [Methyloversatilis sp.]|uniref:MmoB/DmpM family protein n=1 Tax=Methyloversatilis sp. TaxID=2569862 RepID=UPI002736AD05|nr:MmoB/DmpM family protein [Methyloversatilis sp.]MDP3874873.1 MmoB/DmpM family protein [Methyloversatilis sp.]